MADDTTPVLAANRFQTPTIDPDVLESWMNYVQRFEDDDAFIQGQIEQSVMVTAFDRLVKMVDGVYNLGRRSSIWPLQFGLACCAIEMISTAASRFDIDRFGAGLSTPQGRPPTPDLRGRPAAVPQVRRRDAGDRADPRTEGD